MDGRVIGAVGLTFLSSCGGAVAPDTTNHDAGADAADDTPASAICEAGGIPVLTLPRRLEDLRHGVTPVPPVYAAWSGCPPSSTVRLVEEGTLVTLPVGRPTSALFYGDGYLPTRGAEATLTDADRPGPGITAFAIVAGAEFWRPRLPRYTADAPMVVVVLTDLGAGAPPPTHTCSSVGARVEVVDAPSATVTYLGPAPAFAATSGGVATDSGIAVIDGLPAGEAPRIEVTPPTGCSIVGAPRLAPLENGVISVHEVFLTTT